MQFTQFKELDNTKDDIADMLLDYPVDVLLDNFNGINEKLKLDESTTKELKQHLKKVIADGISEFATEHMNFADDDLDAKLHVFIENYALYCCGKYKKWKEFYKGSNDPYALATIERLESNARECNKMLKHSDGINYGTVLGFLVDVEIDEEQVALNILCSDLELLIEYCKCRQKYTADMRYLKKGTISK